MSKKKKRTMMAVSVPQGDAVRHVAIDVGTTVREVLDSLLAGDGDLWMAVVREFEQRTNRSER